MRRRSAISDSATEQSFVVSDLATALADERTAAALTILHPGAASLEQLHAAKADVDAGAGPGKHARGGLDGDRSISGGGWMRYGGS